MPKSKTDVNKKRDNNKQIERGSGNIFVDLGFGPEEAANLILRSQLMLVVKDAINKRGGTRDADTKGLGTKNADSKDAGTKSGGSKNSDTKKAGTESGGSKETDTNDAGISKEADTKDLRTKSNGND